ncbi:hypothetical protein LTR36_001749 [Oleoguttula mirabilis]|uniref:Vps72/YL1 C-terminal domain-containing protein n=1 Tax=Oleoguttula mirabilis TaxID=1507867 RepID=A0AAV9JMK9_9PEZI|nr:hypothetical protein LTR36_001749 [Oleoguttula mirabilis]
MSDDEQSDSVSVSDEGESAELQATGLVANRSKRLKAGNIYVANILPNLDIDPELRKEALFEDESDAGDYEGSVKDDEDDALESSSEDDDAGPAGEGEEDLDGEKALKKEERKEVRNKRKAADARLKLPSWQKKNKKVKLADDVKAEDGAPDKRKKKSERSNWLPTAADAPVRQSGRSLAVESRETTHAHLKESYERSEKQRRVMKNAAEREKTTKRRVMTQAERLATCEKIARQTDKEFGRWEREEADRQRVRDEALAAKRNKGFDGPYVRQWSGSVLWEGEKIIIKRMSHEGKKVEEIMDEPKQAAGSGMKGAVPAGIDLSATPNVQATGLTGNRAPPPPIDTPSQPASTAHPSEPWLQGIHDYASQPAPMQPTPSQQVTSNSINATTPNASLAAIAPAFNGTQTSYPPPLSAHHAHPPPYAQPAASNYGSWPPGAQNFPVHLPPAPPPAPLLREQAQRSLVILSQFAHLEPPTSRRSTKPASVLEPTAPASILLPEAFPAFTADETRYLTAKHKRKDLPPEPDKAHCAIICSAKARFRDPKTGLAYYDLHTYKIIQRVLAGGCQWSGLLGGWVGPSYGVMGRPAAGVPEGFAGVARGGVAGMGTGNGGVGGAAKVESGN